MRKLFSPSYYPLPWYIAGNSPLCNKTPRVPDCQSPVAGFLVLEILGVLSYLFLLSLPFIWNFMNNIEFLALPHISPVLIIHLLSSTWTCYPTFNSYSSSLLDHTIAIWWQNHISNLSVEQASVPYVVDCAVTFLGWLTVLESRLYLLWPAL